MANTQYGVQNGDKVRVSFEGKVECLSGYNEKVGVADVEVTLAGGKTFHVEQVPLTAMTVTKPAVPVEPGVGAIIEYSGSGKWVRVPDGWAYISPRNKAILDGWTKWSDFNHSLVRLMTPAEEPLVKR